MDGVNYRHAVDMHKNGPDDKIIREHLKAYQKRGIAFVRDGGDALGVSARAKELAPEYGIDYRTPIFAIHKEGHYGSIVGNGFATMVEFHKRVLEAKQAGADFIKIMTTGILDFNEHGAITGTPLDGSEVKEMVHIAHEEGMAVMSHTNGDYGVQAAVAAGVDSLEHGNYMNEESLAMLAESDTVWVPTLITVRNLLVGRGLYAPARGRGDRGQLYFLRQTAGQAGHRQRRRHHLHRLRCRNCGSKRGAAAGGLHCSPHPSGL